MTASFSDAKPYFSDAKPYFTDDQIDCILHFATQIAGERSAVRAISYHVIGIADLGKKDEATALLRSLQAQDWKAAAQHREFAGANNLLVAILLHIDAVRLRSQDYWVAMRSPFEYLDSASLISSGEIKDPPPVSMSVLPLDKDRRNRR